MQDFLHLSIYEFKSNISRYIRVLERGEHKGIILKRHKQPVGLFALLPRAKKT